MTIKNVTEAKAQLSRLLAYIEETGEEVIIGRAGKPIASLKPYFPILKKKKYFASDIDKFTFSSRDKEEKNLAENYKKDLYMKK